MSSLELRNSQVLATTDEVRDTDDETNPVIFAEHGPNRFKVMSLFFEDKQGGVNDGVTIEEDLDLNTITIRYFTDISSEELTSGPVYEWALKFYEENF